MIATGTAVAWPDRAPVADTSTASSPLELQREAQASRDALRPNLSLSATPAPSPKPKPVAKHLKKQAPIPKPTATKTRAAIAAAPKVAPKAIGSKYTTTDVNVWSAPEQKGTLLTVLPRGSKVSVTGKVQGIWAEIVREDKSRWVKAQYLSATKPAAQTSGGISAAACKSGSAVESGLTADAIRVHRAVCARFPSVTSYGGVREGDGGEHGVGRALDIMVSGSTGDEIAAFVKANYKALGVSEVLWEQHIWTVQRSSEGWRPMSDRGSVTANHYDHVHVTVYGSAGTA
ncbi:MAG TPA: SH3 domain-containing protein [Kribbella sp.]|nr:SH3 domain-containing protein [Kribbella sp.]